MGAGSGVWDWVWREAGSGGWCIWGVVGGQRCPYPVADFKHLQKYTAPISRSCDLVSEQSGCSLRICCKRGDVLEHVVVQPETGHRSAVPTLGAWVRCWNMLAEA
jgi:hypothetical protein